jgi:ribokinase
VVTLGAAGALLATGAEAPTSVPALEVTAVDTTGAGDAFVGTFAVALAAGLPAAEAVRLGCVGGALSVQRTGAQASFPTGAELTAAADAARS